MKNILIRDESKILKSIENVDKTENVSIFAKSGRVVNPSAPALVLSDGIIQSQKADKNIQTVKFQKTVLNLSEISTKGVSQPKMQETSTMQILNCITPLSSSSWS